MSRFVFALSCALFAVNLNAADAVKAPMSPGLWEITSHMQSDDPKIAKAMEEAQRAMANMPESQRKMMQEMMKKQGVQISADAPGETKVTMCMTLYPAGYYTHQIMYDAHVTYPAGWTAFTALHEDSRSGNTVNFEFACTDPVSSGTGTYVFSSDSSYTMDMKIASAAGGATQNLTITGTGKRLSTDCGDVKPIVMPK